MERQNTKLGRLKENKRMNKRLGEEIKIAAQHINGYPTGNNHKSDYFRNRYYNILRSSKSTSNARKRCFNGTKAELLKTLRECSSFDEEDIEQELYLSILKSHHRKVIFQKGFRGWYFYINSKDDIARFILVYNDLISPIKGDMDDIVTVNLLSSNIEDVVNYNPEKNLEYDLFLSRLSKYERNILFLLSEGFEREDICDILKVGTRMYNRDLIQLVEKVRRFYGI